MKNGVNTAITKNYSISILRVVGMFSIVFCHFFSWLGFSFLSQFLITLLILDTSYILLTYQTTSYKLTIYH